MSALLRATTAGSRPAANRQSSSSGEYLKVQGGRAGGLTPSSSSANLAENGSSLQRNLNKHIPRIEIPKPPADWKQRVKNAYKRHNIKYLNPLVFIMIYMLIGAIIFLWLEGSADEKRKQDTYFSYTREKEMLLRRMEEIFEMSSQAKRARGKLPGDRAARTRPVRRKFLMEAVDYYEDRIGVSIPNTTHWDLATAMYYAGTLFTTIGYGDVSCVTTAGRILTVIYSCVGIPLMLITLSDLGKFLYESINGTVKGMEDFVDYLGVFRICSRKNNVDVKIDDIDAAEKGETQTIDSLHSEMGSTRTFREDDLDEDLDEESKIPKMSVKVALGITLGWIFFCSSLFRLWEDWTYGESCYFMFISLSTIGLGDVAVQHRGMMVLCFVFVIVGLSLVSMCINVVQVAIEDMYMQFLMKMIMEYQEKMAAGGDPKGASMGMMRMWGNNKTAQLLMPLLGKDKKKLAMERVEVEAKARGIEIPPILADLDEKTGMPKILQIVETKSKKDEPDVLPPELELIVEKHMAIAEKQAQAAERASMRSQIIHEQEREEPIPMGVPQSFFAHDADTQTETVQCLDEQEQTEEKSTEESSAQTDKDERGDTQEASVQTIQKEEHDDETQTPIIEMRDDETATPTVVNRENDSQTVNPVMKEQELQTYVVDLLDAETSTSVETKNARIQTPHPQIMDKTLQTDDLSEVKSSSPSKMSSARKRIRRALRITSRARRNTLDNAPTMTDWVDEEGEGGEEGMEDEGSVESLHWDPVDGLHAEKQLPVQRLKAMFDRKVSQ